MHGTGLEAGRVQPVHDAPKSGKRLTRQRLVAEGAVKMGINAGNCQMLAVAIDRLELLRLLRQAAQTTGLVILTDSDGAGFLIRNTLKSALPETGVLHAYIPDLPGKEKRKAAPGKEGLLGVEGMTPEILLKALRNAGAEFADGSTPPPTREPITKQDLFALGLSGGPESAKKRAALLKALRLPAHMSANALLQALNVLFSREEFFTQARRLLEP